MHTYHVISLLGKRLVQKLSVIVKFVILRHDTNSSQNAQNYLRENPAKVSRRKSAKSFLAKKSAKLRELSRAAEGLGSFISAQQDMEKMCKKTKIAT
jgi:hypothetical protein